MNKTILLAGALLALTGAAVSPASAATPYVNQAFRGAAAYRTAYRAPIARMPLAQRRMPIARAPLAQRGYRAPARMAVRPSYLRNLAAVPSARVAFKRAVATGYGYRGARPAVRPQAAYNRFAYRGARAAYGRFAYRGYGRVAQRFPVQGVRRVAVTRRLVATVAPTQTPSIFGSFGQAQPAPAPAPARAPVAAAGGGQTGGASYYSGGRTASGGFVGAATCAHRSLPFGTRLMVTNLSNARQTVCTVNDRGPFIGGRIVDLSRGAAGAIGMLGAGVAPVRLTIVGRS